MHLLSRLTALFLMSLSGLSHGTAPGSMSGFNTTLQGERSSLAVRSAFVLPGETVRISAEVPFRFDGGKRGTDALWRAPEQSGLQSLQLTSDDGKKVLVNVFILTPYRNLRDGKLSGYRIGSYAKGTGPYRQPGGFVEVNAQTASVWVSPHFQLQQFLCKQPGGFPKFVILSERLLIKLELILQRLHARSIKADTLFIMSGYRTPAYNHSLGNVGRSRHLYGDAADIFVDSNPRDGRMDDLNGDGRSDLKDSEVLRDVVQSLEAERTGNFPVGGLGLYTSNHAHGPFVHVDARGHAAKWTGVGVVLTDKPKKRPAPTAG